jgi:hypothetical protein
MSYKSPTEAIGSNLSLAKFDLAKEEASFAANGKKSIRMVGIKANDAPFRIVLNGQLSTDGIIVSTEYHTHSLGFKFEDDEDQEAFEEIYNIFKPLDLSEYEQKSIIKDDTIWLKCKFPKDKKDYNFKSNIKLNPKKPQDASFCEGQAVKVTGELKAYFNLEDKIYGLSFQMKALDTLDQ